MSTADPGPGGQRGLNLPAGITELVDPADEINHLWWRDGTMMRSLCGEHAAYRTALSFPVGNVARHVACQLALGMLLADRQDEIRQRMRADMREHGV